MNESNVPFALQGLITPRGEIVTNTAQQSWAFDGWYQYSATAQNQVELDKRDGYVLRCALKPEHVFRTFWLCIYIEASLGYDFILEWRLRGTVVLESNRFRVPEELAADGYDPIPGRMGAVEYSAGTARPYAFMSSMGSAPSGVTDGRVFFGHRRVAGTKQWIYARVNPFTASLAADWVGVRCLVPFPTTAITVLSAIEVKSCTF